jgi:CheY-like chemotaxis protein
MKTPPRILVVDDTPANVHILQARLSANGYDIVIATDGEAALTAVRESEPDLILLDVMMPKMDGFEVCRRLRADPSLPFIPIIMVTRRTKDVVAGLKQAAQVRRRSPWTDRAGCPGEIHAQEPPRHRGGAGYRARVEHQNSSGG